LIHINPERRLGNQLAQLAEPQYRARLTTQTIHWSSQRHRAEGDVEEGYVDDRDLQQHR
jgi:hypothetical protein